MLLMAHKGNMTPSKEDYLKAILELSGDEGTRSVDIANALGVTKASVSIMMKTLRNEGYIAKKKYGEIKLTEKGREIAVDIKRKYELLNNFLHDVLGVEAATAADDACRIEHLISPETVEQISRHLQLEGGEKRA
jgi:Mn-dependent DtxR family transcriptional regulator